MSKFWTEYMSEEDMLVGKLFQYAPHRDVLKVAEMLQQHKERKLNFNDPLHIFYDVRELFDHYSYRIAFDKDAYGNTWLTKGEEGGKINSLIELVNYLLAD